MKKVRALNSLTLLSAVLFQENISSQLKKRLVAALNNGLVAGYPVVDIKATLFDGSYHEVDSSEMAFKTAASLALKEAAKKCDPVLLEPIMDVEITAPSEYLGSVMGDVTKDVVKSETKKKEETLSLLEHTYLYLKCSVMLLT